MRLLSLALLVFDFMDEHLVSEELTVALEVTGVLPKLINLNRGMTLGAVSSKLGALVIQEVVIYRVLVQSISAPVWALLPHRLAIVPHMIYIVIVFVVL